MSPSKKSPRELRWKGATARRSHAAARPFRASAFVLIAAAAFAQLYAYAPFAQFAPAASAQKQDEQKKYEEQKRVEEKKGVEGQGQQPVQTPLQENRREAKLVANPRLITLCPGEPTRVRLATRPPAR